MSSHAPPQNEPGLLPVPVPYGMHNALEAPTAPWHSVSVWQGSHRRGNSGRHTVKTSLPPVGTDLQPKPCGHVPEQFCAHTEPPVVSTQMPELHWPLSVHGQLA